MIARDLLKLNTATHALYEPGLDVSVFVSRAFAFISALVPTDLCGCGVLDTASQCLEIEFDRQLFSSGSSRHAYDLLMRKYAPFPQEPSVLNDPSGPVGGIDVYQENTAPSGEHDHYFLHILDGSDTALFFGLFRGGKSFHTREKNLLALAQPHLVNARRVALTSPIIQDAPASPDIFTRHGFTPREGEVIHWLVQGKSNLEIAAILRIRPDSVSDYLCTIYEKMGVENRVAAALGALDLARNSRGKCMEYSSKRKPAATPSR